MKKKIDILIVGVGNIGKRHFESLIKHKNEFNIYLCDKKKIANNIKGYKKYTNNIEEFKGKNFFCTIISSTANKRLSLLKKIISNISCNYFVLEKPLEQSLTNLKEIYEIDNYNKKKLFVNLPRRYYPFYKNIKKKLKNTKILEFKVNGNYGIACNGIHFLDLFKFILTNNKIKIHSTKGKWKKSKRSKFIEFHGLVKAKSLTKQTTITLKSDFNLLNSCSILMKSKRNSYFIDEVNQKFYKNKKLIKTGIIEHQSALTYKIIKDLINKKSCDLPRVKSIYYEHRELLKSLIHRYNIDLKNTIDKINIT